MCRILGIILQMTRAQHWLAYSGATILPGTLAAILEYILSGGTSGWIPIVAAAAGGILAWVILPHILPSPTSRIFVKKTGSELVEKIKDMTDVAAEPIVDSYIGLWMDVNGRINNVARGIGTVTVYIDGGDVGPGFVLSFGKRLWFDKLKILDKGEKISAVGQIEGVSELFISLEKCELSDDGNNR